MASQNKVIVLSPNKNLKFIDRWYELADDDHFWMQWRISTFLQQCRDLRISSTEPLRGFEIGCGHGVVIRQLEESTSWIIDGAELDQSALERCTHQRGNMYVYDILDKNAQLKEAYDFIILYDVLEHIEMTQPFIEAILFHLKKGGHLFINVPACPALLGPYDKAAGHHRRYTKTMLINEFNEHDLDIIDIRYWGFMMLPALFCRNMVTSHKQPPHEIIEKGFRPPNPLAHRLLKTIMRFEVQFLHRPFIGTSVMAVGKKHSDSV